MTSNSSIRDKLELAFLKVLDNDRHLLAVVANERSLTHRLAVYLEHLFCDSGYQVDCEYNRDNDKTKKLRSFNKTVSDNSDLRGPTVYPDIVIHKRGEPDNKVIIEAKTSASHEPCQEQSNCVCDMCKLRCYKKEFGYEHAFYVVFPVGTYLSNFSRDALSDAVKAID
jgi:hypothetical protein